jgi:hypothetical protein
MAMSSKLKTQEKTNSTAVTGMAAPVAASGASSADIVHSHGLPAAMPLAALSTDPVGASSKEAAAIPDTDTFQRLDAVAAPSTLLHSSPHQIAVGVHDPSLGWLEVQTQSSAGHISATLTAASAEAHASLAAQAPAITQYLADRSVSIHSLNVHAQADPQSGTSGQRQSSSGQENAGHETPERAGMVVEQGRQQRLSETGNENLPQAASASHISIRA